MQSSINMNCDSIIFDQPEKKTINGIPAGMLSESYSHILGSDGKRPPIDLHQIVETFHPKVGDSVECVYSGLPADGIKALDGNPSNFLITNLAPVNQEYLSELPELPNATVVRTFQSSVSHGAYMLRDLELETQDIAWLVKDKLLLIPEIPFELGLAYTEAELMWLWNELTKKLLLKGLTKLTLRNRITDTSVSLTNKAVMEFVIRSLQRDDFLKKEH